MSWNPVTKQITGFDLVRVRQNLEHGGDNLYCPNPITFTEEDLILSLSRTTSLLSAVYELSHEERKELVLAHGSFLAGHLNLFVDGQDSEFSFTKKISILADEQRTSLAAKAGAAVADLTMQRMGFYWSANARELELKRGPGLTKKLPDFAYDPASKHGFQPQSVVVVEAKGSLSRQKAKRPPILKLAREAYNEQVRCVIGAKGKGVVIASGYAVAFGNVPGEHASTLAFATPQPVHINIAPGVPARSLSAAATSQEQPALQPEAESEPMHVYKKPSWRGGGSGGPPDDGDRGEGERRAPSGLIAYANYESAFLLCGAFNAARVIRTILSGQSMEVLEPELLVQDFWIFQHGGMRFWSNLDHPFQFAKNRMLAIYEPSAKKILRSVSANPSTIPETVPLIVASTTDSAEPDRDFAVTIQGDGLALLRLPSFAADHKRWNLREGDWL